MLWKQHFEKHFKLTDICFNSRDNVLIALTIKPYALMILGQTPPPSGQNLPGHYPPINTPLDKTPRRIKRTRG